MIWRRPRWSARLQPEPVAHLLEEAHALGIVGRGAISTPARALIADGADTAVVTMTKVLPAPIDHFVLQADLTVVVPGPLHRALADELGAVATVESAGAAMVYRISEASIRHALDTGRSAGALHAFFAKHSKTPVPQGLTYLIDDVARRHGQLRVGMAASFVRCEDPRCWHRRSRRPPHSSSTCGCLHPPSRCRRRRSPTCSPGCGRRAWRRRPRTPPGRSSTCGPAGRGCPRRAPPAVPAAAECAQPGHPGGGRRRAPQGGDAAVRCARRRGWRRPARWRCCSRPRWQQAQVVIGYIDRGRGGDAAGGGAHQRARRPAGGVRSGLRPGTGLRRAPRDVSGVGRRRNNGRMTDGPLIVQSDKTVLLEVDHEQAGAARAAIAPFAELERAPEHVHTYRITPLALWNARAAGHDAEQVVDALVSFSRYAVPQPLLVDIVDTMARYGRLQLVKSPVHGLMLVSLDRAVLEEVLRNKKIAPMLGARVDDDTVIVHPVRARPRQADAAQDRLAGRGPRRLRQRRGAPDQPAPGRLAPARLPADGRRLVLGGRLRVWWYCRAVRARPWSVPPQWPRQAPPR